MIKYPPFSRPKGQAAHCLRLLLPDVGARHHPPRIPRNQKLFVGGNHPQLNPAAFPVYPALTPRERPVSPLIDRYPEPVEPLADLSANTGRVLSNSAREDNRIRSVH